MRMLRVALVLLVLASFIAATAAVSMAATVTPTVKPTAKATLKPTSSIKPIKSTGKMIDLQQMKTTVGNVYKNLMKSTKMPAKPAMPGKNATATPGVSKSVSGLNAQKSLSQYSPSMQLNAPSMRSIQTPAIMNQLGAMPQVGVQMDHLASSPCGNLATTSVLTV
ncbi:MAG: hypothetical protein WBZ29_05590 [Methanocella sp.]